MNGNQEGHKTWVVPDGWLPPAGGDGGMINHESLMILNTGAWTSARPIWHIMELWLIRYDNAEQNLL